MSVAITCHSMQNAIVRIFLAALLAPLAACAPWPHVEHMRPGIEGRLVQGGKPVPGAAVFLGARPGTNDPCAEAGEQVDVSPADGSFRIPAQAHAKFMQSLLNPPDRSMRLTAVCIRYPDGGVRIGALVAVFIDKPANVSLDCDLSKGRNDLGNAQVSSPLGQPQVCQATRIPLGAP